MDLGQAGRRCRRCLSRPGLGGRVGGSPQAAPAPPVLHLVQPPHPPRRGPCDGLGRPLHQRPGAGPQGHVLHLPGGQCRRRSGAGIRPALAALPPARRVHHADDHDRSGHRCRTVHRLPGGPPGQGAHRPQLAVLRRAARGHRLLLPRGPGGLRRLQPPGPPRRRLLARPAQQGLRAGPDARARPAPVAVAAGRRPPVRLRRRGPDGEGGRPGPARDRRRTRRHGPGRSGRLRRAVGHRQAVRT